MIRLCAVLSLAAMLVLGTTVVAAGHPAKMAVGPPPPWMVELARSEAVQNGDAHPIRVHYAIRGNRAVVTLHGHFICRRCTRPLGANPPRGTVMTLVVSMRTHTIESFGLGNR